MHNLKSYIIILSFSLLIFACEKKEPATQTSADTLSEVINRGELRAGYFVQPPAVMKDPATGEVYGTFVDAAREIAEEIDVELELVEVDLAKFAAGLQTGLYDVSIGPTFRTIPRAANVEFTQTIFYLGYDGVVASGRATEFPDEASIDKSGVRVAVKEGSAIHTYVVNNFNNAELIVLAGNDLTLPLQAVSSGQADVGLMNEHTVEYYVRANPEVETVLADSPIQVLGMSWAVLPGDNRWRNFLNTSLEALVATGKMASYERKHYGEKLRRELVEPDTATAR